MSDKTQVLMVVRTDKDSAEVSAMFKRVSSAMSAIMTFSDKMAELDEDGPNLTAEVGPLLARLTLTLMSIYPNSRQMDVDIESIGDFSTKTIDELKREYL